MVDRRIVRLKLTQQEAERYFPPKGISVIWLDWKPDKGEVVAEFVCSSLNPDPLFRKTMADIRHELGTTFRNRVIEDDLTSHDKSPRRALVVESILNHPFLVGGKDTKGLVRKDLLPASMPLTTRELQDAAENAIDVHEVIMTPQEAEENLRLGSTGEKLHVEPEEVRQERRLVEEGQALSPEEGGSGGITKLREVYGPEKNVYLSGVLDSG